MWRWLFEKKHSISPNDRPKILRLFKEALYTETVDQFEQKCDELISDEVFVKYQNLVAYIESLLDIKDAWAISYRKDEKLSLRDSQTNNYIECKHDFVSDFIFHFWCCINVPVLSCIQNNQISIKFPYFTLVKAIYFPVYLLLILS